MAKYLDTVLNITSFHLTINVFLLNCFVKMLYIFKNFMKVDQYNRRLFPDF